MKNFLFVFYLFLLGLSTPVVALIPDFTANKVCLGQVTTLVDHSTPSDSIQYRLWDLNGDGYFGDDTGRVVTHFFSFAGKHNVGLKIITHTGYAKAIYKFVLVTSVDADFTFIPNCINQAVYFFDRSQLIMDTVQNYTWNFGDGSLPNNEKKPIHYFTSAGEYITKFIVLTRSGCLDTAEQNIIIPPLPEYSLVFSGDTSFIEGDSVIASIVGDNDSILWSTDQTSSSIVIKQQGNYWVRVFKNGCSKQTDFHITVKQYGTNPVITTLFTPNGDGYNDRWEILNLHKVGPCVVNVYDRWGTQVFFNNDYQNEWNGTYQGKVLSNDTYFYFVRCFDGKLYKGTVNILK